MTLLRMPTLAWRRTPQPYDPLDEGTPTAWLRPDMICVRNVATVGSGISLADGWAVGDGTANAQIYQVNSTAGDIGGRWNLGTGTLMMRETVKVSTLAVDAGFRSLYLSANQYISTYFTTATNLLNIIFRVGGTTVGQYSAAFSPVIDQAYKIEWYWNATTLTLSIDGISQSLTAVTTMPAGQALGTYGDGTHYLARNGETARNLNGAIKNTYLEIGGTLVSDFALAADYINRAPGIDGGAAALWRNYVSPLYAAQSTLANRPTFDADLFGAGLPGLTFDDTDLYIAPATTGGIKCPMPATVFAVCKWVGGGTGTKTLVRGDNWYLAISNATNKPQMYAGSSVIGSDTMPAGTCILVATIESGAATLWVDGVQKATGNCGTGTTGSTTYMNFVGPVGEVVLYPEVKTGAQILRILNYLQRKYGLAVSEALT
jgi:hypothetical protein